MHARTLERTGSFERTGSTGFADFKLKTLEEKRLKTQEKKSKNHQIMQIAETEIVRFHRDLHGAFFHRGDGDSEICNY